ncbi:MAG TPA: hypothetical protein VJO54_10065 [Burkholderiales bacterium]|nr:hypothetical protein [Burkholderiales bacterium]
MPLLPALVFALGAQSSPAQALIAWTRVPTVGVVANGDDPRVALVDEAVSFWNDTLAGLGSGLRLGPVTRVDQSIPEGDLDSLSRAGRRRFARGNRGCSRCRKRRSGSFS